MSVVELPSTDTEWRYAIDCAGGAIAFDAAQKYGLIKGGPQINVERAETLLKLGAARGFHPRAHAPEAFALSLLELQEKQRQGGVCQVCGCTDDDCSGCVERTGRACHWVNEEHTLCSACVSDSLELALTNEEAVA